VFNTQPYPGALLMVLAVTEIAAPSTTAEIVVVQEAGRAISICPIPTSPLLLNLSICRILIHAVATSVFQ
jgi:hypothetical protein